MMLLSLLVLALLVAVASVRPTRSPMSEFELTRRAEKGDKIAAKRLQRENMLSDILSLQRVCEALLLVVFVVPTVVALGWTLGIVVAAVVALEYGALARIPLWQRPVQKLYEQYEDHILGSIEKLPWLFRVFRSVTPNSAPRRQLESREELLHLVGQSGHLLSPDEKKIITHSLEFELKRVGDIMTPRSVISSVDKKELLGPLVLDDLHRTGHSRFPVIDGDVDHVVGMLYIQDLLTLDKKRSLTVEKTMEPRFFYIRQDHTLAQALTAFLRTHHHLFVVINEYRETVGLISLEDVLEVLLGRKIIDEFDAHDDLRAVAARNPQAFNSPKHHEDI